MKLLKSYIQEKLVIKKNKATNYKYFPETKKELEDIIKQRIKQEGIGVNLNDIDVSHITDMSYLFQFLDFNGDISKWDVSNVTNMYGMFLNCYKFNQDISSWDVSNVTDMSGMFYICKKFNQDISKWNVSNVTNMSFMFYNCKNFNQDISKWDVSKVKNKNSIIFMFDECQIEEKYKPKF